MNVGNGLSLELGKYQKQVNIRLREMQDQHFAKRLWNKEEGLWRKDDFDSEKPHPGLGWLNAPSKMLKQLPQIEEFCASIHSSGFTHVVLLGMGGSSMTPLVFQKVRSFKPAFASDVNTQLKFHVLDSTEPEVIQKIEQDIDHERTLFIVSSKSGNTAEIVAFFNYFYDGLKTAKGDQAGQNFIAITDKGSPLDDLATKKKFRKIFLNFSDIGGRYSALSYFGIVPAALMGVDVKTLLERAQLMVTGCGPKVLESQNPGLILGATIAELAVQGCDKLTYVLPPSLSAFGLWLEQLLAESTGKNNTGILPLNGLPFTEIDNYGKDRSFFQMEFQDQKDLLRTQKMKSLHAKEYPLISIQIQDELDLGAEFFRWEIATAAAGAILGIDPFDQPNVQESKKCTLHLLQTLEEKGSLEELEPTLTEDSIRYHSSLTQKNSLPFSSSLYPDTAAKLLKYFLQSAKAGDFISLQSYLPEDEQVITAISEIREHLHRTVQAAITTEFGPRYLHSTGQYHKGGPNTGLFIQFTNSSVNDLQIPGLPYTFGSLKRAQVIGDMQALIKNKRRVLLIDLGNDIDNGLKTIQKAVKSIEPIFLSEHYSKMDLKDHPVFSFSQANALQSTVAVTRLP